MTATDIADVLWTWTPYLAGGFAWNILLSIVTMAIGTPIGLLLAAMRASHRRSAARTGNLLTGVARNIPTFVMLFYLAYMLPPEVTVLGQTLPVPAWVKASLALAVAVAGFVSDNALPAIRHLRRHDTAAALLFLPAWTNYFLIIVMASSTASVIGVPEIVQRANTVVGAVGDVDVMLWIYLYAMVWFFAVCWPLALTMQVVRRRLRHRADARWGGHRAASGPVAAAPADAAVSGIPVGRVP
ncbi:MAG: ABC transporter permease subunit [Rhodospirillaceae bacterium]|nr:ABC transporter permease subunit [Rhodospirillaceae bacterium]